MEEFMLMIALLAIVAMLTLITIAMGGLGELVAYGLRKLFNYIK